MGLFLCVPAAVTAPVLGLVLVAEGWKAYRAERLMIMAEGLAPEDQISLLEAELVLTPHNALRHHDLAQLHLREAKKLLRRVAVNEAVQVVLGPGASGTCPQDPFPFLTSVPAWLTTSAVGREILVEDARMGHLEAGLWHLLEARNACPLLAGPHIDLAIHTDWLRRADSPIVYLDRAKGVPRQSPPVVSVRSDSGARGRFAQAATIFISLSILPMTICLRFWRYPVSRKALTRSSRRLCRTSPICCSAPPCTFILHPTCVPNRYPVWKKPFSFWVKGETA